ncbi:MAG: hypothetical protein LH609_21835 [Rudanella sp.]|nr:hypothetical protein [Rudanella sp.]
MKTFDVYPTMTLTHLQQCFAERFPCLRMEHTGVKRIPGKLGEKVTMETLGRGPSSWCFLVEGDMNVAELYANLQECFGLTVRVDRWTGCAWHDTGDTPHQTLEQQNQQGVGIVVPDKVLCQ